MEQLSKIAQAIKELRLVSIFSLLFTMNMMNEFLQWVMTSKPAELGEALAVTGIMTTLVALVKFIFEFAIRKE